MIPISITDQLAALIRDREKREADPNAAWSEYLEGHYGPERMAAAALAEKLRYRELKAERDRVLSGLNLPSGVSPVWKSHRTAELVGFKAVLIAPTFGNRKLGAFDTLEEAIEAIDSLRAKLTADRERYSQIEAAERRTKLSDSDPLPAGVIRRPSRKGYRYAARISQILPDGKRLQRMISTHDTPQQAHDAYRMAHIELHGEASRYWNQRHEL